MTCRIGKAEDIEACLPLAAEFWSATGYSEDIPFDADSTTDYFMLAIASGLLVVAESDGEIVGFAAGITAPALVNRDVKIGAELAWWINPSHRGGILAIKMLRLIEWLAQKAGCKIWSMMLLESLDPVKVESMYLGCGYFPAERTFIKRF